MWSSILIAESDIGAARDWLQRYGVEDYAFVHVKTGGSCAMVDFTNSSHEILFKLTFGGNA